MSSVVPCVAGSSGCTSIYNKSGVDIGFVNVKDPKTLILDSSTNKPLEVKNGSHVSIKIQNSALIIWAVDVQTLAKMKQLTPGVDSEVIVSPGFFRPFRYAGRYFTFWIPIIGFLIVGILSFVFASKMKTSTLRTFCETNNFSDQECQDQIEDGMGPSLSGSTGLKGFGIFSFVLSVIFIVLYVYVLTTKFVSYSTCAKRVGFGTQWKWVKPKSKFRGFLCSVFGACECASDTLNYECLTYSFDKQDNVFVWDETGAAQSSSPSKTCFCCDRYGGSACVSVELDKMGKNCK